MKVHVVGIGRLELPEKLVERLARVAARSPRAAEWVWFPLNAYPATRKDVERIFEWMASLPLERLRRLLVRTSPSLLLSVLYDLTRNPDMLEVYLQAPSSVSLFILRNLPNRISIIKRFLDRYGRPKRWYFEHNTSRLQSLTRSFGMQPCFYLLILTYDDFHVLIGDKDAKAVGHAAADIEATLALSSRPEPAEADS